ncbi:MAG: type II secretion system F family protein [Pirellulaceae bacterium]
MANFAYQARDSAGRVTTGMVESVDEPTVRQELAARGLTLLHLSPTPAGQPAAGRSWSPYEAETLLGQLSQVAMTGATLVDGLRAAAAESPNRRVADGLRRIADEVQRGRPLADAVSDTALHMPPHVRGLVEAASRSGRLGYVLDELLDQQRQTRGLFWSMWSALAYPIVVLVLASLLMVFFLTWVVPPFESMFSEFELRLPASTETLVQASRSIRSLLAGSLPWFALAAAVCVAAVVYAAASGRGGPQVQILLGMMPLCGPLWVWSGAARFLRLLSLLLSENVPLPEALRLTGAAVENAGFQYASRLLADGVQSGQSLADLVETSGCLPASAVPLLRWGEQRGVLAEATETLAGMFTERIAGRTAWLRSVSPAVIYVLIIISLGFALTSLFLPIVSLIQGLM